MSLTTDNKASRLFKALMGVSETKTTRDFFEEPIRSAAAVLPGQIWKYGDKIPDGSDPTKIAAVKALSNQATFATQVDESTSVAVIKRWISHQLTMIDAGTNNSFKLMEADGTTPITNIIPFNFGDGVSYNYALTKNDNSVIAFGVGDWVLDTNSGVLTFYGTLPAGVAAVTPPKLSFYQYIGGVGIPPAVSGFEGALTTIVGYQGAVNTAAWSSYDSDLGTRVTAALNNVWGNFEAIFGWDGDDTHEGVAIAYEKLTPVFYSKTRDVVKSGNGGNASATASSEVVSLLARTHVAVNFNTITGLTVDFVSQQAGPTPTFKYTADGSIAMSLDGSTFGAATTGINTLTANSAVKVKVGNAWAIVRRTLSSLPAITAIDTLSVTDDQSSVALLYWNADVRDYLPYVDATSSFDFSIPVVMKLGKIPPSIKFSQTSSGGFSDAITPEYYGVRPTSIVVAVNGATTAYNSPTPEGSDYIVTNTAGGYFENIIAKILAAQPANFAGEIVLRAGTYQMYDDLTLANQPGLKIRGEFKDSVFIQALNGTRTLNVTASSVGSNVFIADATILGTLQIHASTSDVGQAQISLTSVTAPDTSLVVDNGCNVIISRVSSLGSLNISGSIANLGDRLIESSTIGTITHNGTNTIYRGVIANSFVGLGGGTNTWIGNSFFINLASIDLSTQFIGNTMLSYGATVDDRFKMLTGKFEVIDGANGQRYWTTFLETDPIVYDAIAHRFKLQIDSTTLTITDGKLTVNAYANVIKFNNTLTTRPDAVAVTATDVQGALDDLYSTKADLIGGKILLNQLPDSVAAGGMTYKGQWNFDDHAGAYPTLAELLANVGGIGPGNPSSIPPGWFVVISPSTVTPGMPAADQVAVLQANESTPLSFTVGDWAIYNGVTYERIDNAAVDPSFAILPTTPPDGAWSDGLLDLGKTTIVEGFDQVNEILAKLAPPKPVNLNTMSLVYKSPTPAPFSAKDLNDITRSPVFDSSTPNLGTNSSPNDINGLFYNGDTGTLTASIDSTPVGSRALTSADDTGTYGALKILADMDPWLGTTGKANFWKGLRATIAPVSALAFGSHLYTLNMSGTVTNATIYNDNPALGLDASASSVTMTISGASITATPDPAAKYLSGVPSIAANSQFTISEFDALNVVSQFYNATQVAQISSSVSGVSPISLMPVTHDNPAVGDHGRASMNQTIVSMPTTAYNENITFTVTPFSAKGTAGTPTTLTPGFRIDTTLENERVYSGSAAQKYPTIGATGVNCGAPWDSTQSLVDGNFTGELQKIGVSGGTYRWPAGNYSAFAGGTGPNYAGATGVTVGGASGTWRWVTFKLTAAMVNASAFTLALNGTSGGWVADSNKLTQNVMILTKVVGSSGTGWLDANAAYPGSGTPVNDGDPAMSAGDSNTSAISKRVTFGPVTRTGDLYVRIGIAQGSGLSFSGITVS
jgi:hypothetical protein